MPNNNKAGLKAVGVVVGEICIKIYSTGDVSYTCPPSLNVTMHAIQQALANMPSNENVKGSDFLLAAAVTCAFAIQGAVKFDRTINKAEHESSIITLPPGTKLPDLH